MSQPGLFEFEEEVPKPTYQDRVEKALEDIKARKEDPKAYKTHITQIEAKYQDDSYILTYLREKALLWDMRCWKELKNKDEIMKKILAIKEVHHIFSILNDGHAAFLIRTYLDHHGNTLTAHGEIMGCFMANNNITFSKRITDCMIDATKCPHYIKHLNYAACPCMDCKGDKEK